jgi:hypothetical protein
VCAHIAGQFLTSRRLSISKDALLHEACQHVRPHPLMVYLSPAAAAAAAPDQSIVNPRACLKVQFDLRDIPNL